MPLGSEDILPAAGRQGFSNDPSGRNGLYWSSDVVLGNSPGDPALHLATPPGVPAEARRAGLGWLEKMNSEYAAGHSGESSIEARVRSYEVAASMQLQVPKSRT